MNAEAARRQSLWHSFVACLLVGLLIGCTVPRAVDMRGTASLVENIKPHDRVKITTTDGREVVFEVVNIEPDALIGKDVRIGREDIHSLEVTEFSPVRTAGLVTGAGVSAVVVTGFIVAAIAPALILAAAAP